MTNLTISPPVAHANVPFVQYCSTLPHSTVLPLVPEHVPGVGNGFSAKYSVSKLWLHS